MSATDKLNYYVAQVDKELSKYPSLTNLERQTQVPKAYAVLGASALFVLLIFFNIAAGFLSNLIGVVVPVYFSMRALETPQAQDDVQWLTYWCVFGVFTILETFSDILVSWFPFYYSVKTLALLYLVLPQTRGAVTLYQKLLRPLVFQHFTTPTAAPAPQ